MTAKRNNYREVAPGLYFFISSLTRGAGTDNISIFLVSSLTHGAGADNFRMSANSFKDC
jgi:hypothetical protein